MPTHLRAGGDLQADLDGLSPEHIIPGAVGGTHTTLSCRRCNNNQGSAVDGHFISMIRGMDWYAGDGSKYKGSLQVGDHQLPMKMAWGNGENPTVIEVPGGEPKLLELAVSALRAMKDGDRLRLNVKFKFNAYRARRGLIRIAYLVLFEGRLQLYPQRGGREITTAYPGRERGSIAVVCAASRRSEGGLGKVSFRVVPGQ